MLNRKNKIVLEDAGTTSAADMLAELLEFHHVTQLDFSKRIGVSQKHLSNIMNKKAFMSPELALTIEAVTGMSAKMLQRLDVNYQLNNINDRDDKSKKHDETYMQPYD